MASSAPVSTEWADLADEFGDSPFFWPGTLRVVRDGERVLLKPRLPSCFGRWVAIGVAALAVATLIGWYGGEDARSKLWPLSVFVVAAACAAAVVLWRRAGWQVELRPARGELHFGWGMPFLRRHATVPLAGVEAALTIEERPESTSRRSRDISLRLQRTPGCGSVLVARADCPHTLRRAFQALSALGVMPAVDTTLARETLPDGVELDITRLPTGCDFLPWGELRFKADGRVVGRVGAARLVPLVPGLLFLAMAALALVLFVLRGQLQFLVAALGFPLPLGILLVFVARLWSFRQRLFIDPSTGTISLRRNTDRREEYPLSDVSAVQLCSYLEGDVPLWTGSGELNLVMRDADVRRVTILNPARLPSALRAAKELAEHLGLPLLDHSGVAPVPRPPSQPALTATDKRIEFPPEGGARSPCVSSDLVVGVCIGLLFALIFVGFGVEAFVDGPGGCLAWVFVAGGLCLGVALMFFYGAAAKLHYEVDTAHGQVRIPWSCLRSRGRDLSQVSAVELVRQRSVQGVWLINLVMRGSDGRVPFQAYRGPLEEAREDADRLAELIDVPLLDRVTADKGVLHVTLPDGTDVAAPARPQWAFPGLARQTRLLFERRTVVAGPGSVPIVSALIGVAGLAMAGNAVKFALQEHLLWPQPAMLAILAAFCVGFAVVMALSGRRRARADGEARVAHVPAACFQWKSVPFSQIAFVQLCSNGLSTGGIWPRYHEINLVVREPSGERYPFLRTRAPLRLARSDAGKLAEFLGVPFGDATGSLWDRTRRS